MSETPQEMSAIALGIRPDMTVEVLTMEGNTVFLGKVESCTQEALIVRDARGNDLPRVLYNQEIQLRWIQNDSAAMVSGKVCGSSDQFWKLDRLVRRQFKDQRAFFRQRIRPRAGGKCFRRSSRGVLSEESVPCEVVDVSAGGLLLSTKGIFDKGEHLTVRNIHLVESMEPFTFNCLVRRVGKPDGGVIQYGCQFESLSSKEQDNLLRAIFIIQREGMRLQQDTGRR